MNQTATRIETKEQSVFAFGLRANPQISLDNPTLLKLPFGVAAAIGTLICFVAAHWRLLS